MSDEKDDCEPHQERTVELSSQQLEALRESAQGSPIMAAAASARPRGASGSARVPARERADIIGDLPDPPQEATRSIARASLKQLIKEEIKEAQPSPQAFGILKHAKLSEKSEAERFLASADSEPLLSPASSPPGLCTPSSEVVHVPASWPRERSEPDESAPQLAAAPRPLAKLSPTPTPPIITAHETSAHVPEPGEVSEREAARSEEEPRSTPEEEVSAPWRAALLLLGVVMLAGSVVAGVGLSLPLLPVVIAGCVGGVCVSCAALMR